MADTIFALSSGSPPAGIAVIRISGPDAHAALESLTDGLPVPRSAVVRSLRSAAGDILDQAMVLWLPGPGTVTGEPVAELHCHGGRAVVAAVLAALGALPGLRPATSGEFTRRAFINGRIDLAEAEGLAELLSAETELQRQSALALAGGRFSKTVNGWRQRLLTASAQIEAILDFADEDDAAILSPHFSYELTALCAELSAWLHQPRAETLREGFRVVISGPPNAGKSTLFNALVDDEAAIIAPIAGTTRDVLTRPVALAGVPFVFADTAGLRDGTGDTIEAIGIERAHGAIKSADLVLWLGPQGEGPPGCWEIDPQSDRRAQTHKYTARHRISALTGEGMAGLREDLVTTARSHLPKPGSVALNTRQHGLLADAAAALTDATLCRDSLLAAEELRRARLAFDALLGRTATEDMLDALFGQFCIGK